MPIRRSRYRTVGVRAASLHIDRMAMYYLRTRVWRHRPGARRRARAIAIAKFRQGYRRFVRGRWVR